MNKDNSLILKIERNSLEKLTKREIEILRLIVKGLKQSEIAKLFFISKNTVRTHRQNLMSKLGAKNIIELINKATIEGYI
jgi:DNA-binding NarL/FixJ family response regulator